MAHHRIALAALMLCLAALCNHGSAFKQISEVPFTELDENQKPYVVTAAGFKWTVHRSEEQNEVYFVNAQTRKAVWDDPRAAPLTEEELASLPPEIQEQHRNLNMGVQDMKDILVRSNNLTITVVAVVPLILFAAAVAGRIWYLQTYFPELLFPTKDRKQRYKGSSKFKAQKARGKMSQDGKGGRSANS